MTTIPYRTALIVGAGSGISASVARGLATAGLKVGVAARNVDKLASLAAETGADKVHGRRFRSGGRRAPVRRGGHAAWGARCRALQRQRTGARPDR